MSVSETKSRKYELVAPDGGWGYMVGLGVTLNLATLTCFVNCFGMIFKDFFVEVDMDSTSITFFNGVGAFSVAISGFITSPLLKFMSIRQLGLLTACLFNLGLFWTIFVTSKWQFFISQGMFQGIGNGIIFNLSCTVLNNYFVKRRLLAFSFTQSIAALSFLLSPLFVKWSLETYGYQGTLLLIFAISLHNLIGMSLMQPVEWHMKKVEVPASVNETKLLLIEDKQYETNEKSAMSFQQLDKSEHVINKSDEEHNLQDHNNPIKIFFSRIIDFSLIKSFLLSNACLGVAFSAFLELLSLILMPQALYAMEWNQAEVATALSLCSLADLITRVLIILMNNMLVKVGSHEVYVAGLVVAFISRLGMVWTDNKTVIVAFVTMMGISRCSIMVLIPVVLADSVGQEKFTSAMGMMQLLYGVFNWTIGPAIGAIRDWTDSYTVVYYILAVCHGIVVISWTTEILWKRKNQNKKAKMHASL